MKHDYILWFAVMAYAIHMLEELILDWRKWAEHDLKFTPLHWSTFYMANAVVLFIGIAAASIGWHVPSVGLIIPALMAINGIFFHILPTLIQRAYSPGVITAVFLFIPIDIYIYYTSYLDGVLTPFVAIMSLVWGALLMASPIIFIKLHPILINKEHKNAFPAL